MKAFGRFLLWLALVTLAGVAVGALLGAAILWALGAVVTRSHELDFGLSELHHVVYFLAAWGVK